MKNSLEKATEWVEFLATHPSVPFGERLLAQFKVAEITRLCDCGCNSFDAKVTENSNVGTLTDAATQAGAFFEVAFNSTSEDVIAFIFFADIEGNLAGIDITLGGGNHAPLPESVLLGQVAYTSWLRSNNSLKSDAAKPHTLG